VAFSAGPLGALIANPSGKVVWATRVKGHQIGATHDSLPRKQLDLLLGKMRLASREELKTPKSAIAPTDNVWLEEKTLSQDFSQPWSGGQNDNAGLDHPTVGKRVPGNNGVIIRVYHQAG
jgi:hypothetical protein